MIWNLDAVFLAFIKVVEVAALERIELAVLSLKFVLECGYMLCYDKFKTDFIVS